MKDFNPFADKPRYPGLAAAAIAKREQSHAVAELRMMSKELKILAERAFSLNYPQFGAALIDVSERARQLAGTPIPIMCNLGKHVV